MGIYQIIRGDISCDKCRKFIANITFDKKEEDRLYKSEVICTDCGASRLTTKD